MSSAFAPGELDHLPPEKAERLREMFDVDQWPDPADDGLEHPPGDCRPIDGQHPVLREDYPETNLGTQ